MTKSAVEYIEEKILFAQRRIDQVEKCRSAGTSTDIEMPFYNKFGSLSWNKNTGYILEKLICVFLKYFEEYNFVSRFKNFWHYKMKLDNDLILSTNMQEQFFHKILVASLFDFLDLN